MTQKSSFAIDLTCINVGRRYSVSGAIGRTVRMTYRVTLDDSFLMLLSWGVRLYSDILDVLPLFHGAINGHSVHCYVVNTFFRKF